LQITTTFRHMDASQAVKQYAEERLSRIKKYFYRDPISAHATFAVERDRTHMAEFLVTLANGGLIQARETSADMYSSIDLAWARIERQVRKLKDRVRDHKAGKAPRRGDALEVEAVERSAKGERGGRGKGKVARGAREKAPRPAAPAAPALRLVREETFRLRVMRAEDAVAEMNLLEAAFFVFTDVDSRAVSVVYRRKDGDYGLIATGARGGSATGPVAA
jgi:putative sigma-54 modulation protein